MNALNRLPVTFLPHGGGPWPFVEMGLDRREVEELAAYLHSVRGLPRVAPKALLVVSAHWEARVPTVMTAERPAMLPREEHLMPLMVVAGAAGDDIGRASFNGKIMGVRLSAHDFG